MNCSVCHRFQHLKHGVTAFVIIRALELQLCPLSFVSTESSVCYHLNVSSYMRCLSSFERLSLFIEACYLESTNDNCRKTDMSDRIEGKCLTVRHYHCLSYASFHFGSFKKEILTINSVFEYV